MKRILVVDDEPTVAFALQEGLLDDGYEVEAASDPREALGRIARTRYDLVITDLKMPGVSGLEVLQETKAVSPTTEVIILTAYGTKDAAVEATRHRAFDFLAKPFRLDALREVVRRALANGPEGQAGDTGQHDGAGTLAGSEDVEIRVVAPSDGAQEAWFVDAFSEPDGRVNLFVFHRADGRRFGDATKWTLRGFRCGTRVAGIDAIRDAGALAALLREHDPSLARWGMLTATLDRQGTSFRFATAGPAPMLVGLYDQNGALLKHDPSEGPPQQPREIVVPDGAVLMVGEGCPEAGSEGRGADRGEARPAFAIELRAHRRIDLSKPRRTVYEQASAALEAVIRETHEIGRSVRCGPETIEATTAAVTEAILNAWRWGYGGNEGAVAVEHSCDNGHWVVKVSDNGKGFDAVSYTPPDFRCYAAALGANGRGIPIISGLSDEARIESTVGRGTTVTIRQQIGKLGA